MDLKKWTNAHANFTQPLRAGASFDLTVSDPTFSSQFRTFRERYNQTTKNIQWLIRQAIDRKWRLRAVGSGWSLSRIAVAEDGLVNTKKLRLKARLDASHVAPAYLDAGGDPDDLLFAQCGNTIIEINDLLEQERHPAKSMRASGGSNGQTIVGAFSSGTHGAAYRFGALAECIVGLHIVVGPDRHVWLERASRAVTSDAFAALLDAEVIRDDALFNSALVSFGSFGFIHGVLVEVEPRFLLEQQLVKVPYNAAVERAVQLGDFSGLAPHLRYPLAEVEETLYHFELAINPHHFQKENLEKGAYVRLMYKRPYRPDYTPPVPDANGFTYGDDVLGLMQLVLDKIEKIPGQLELHLIPKLVNSLFKVAYDRPEAAIGTIGETFRNTIFRGKLFSAAFALDRQDVPRAIDLILNLNKRIAFAGVMAMRFVRGTSATLGFTKFPHTCVLELDGADVAINHRFVEVFTAELEANDLPYALHWGKINNVLNPERVRRIYGHETVDTWLNHRRQLLSKDVRDVFTNGFLERCGLVQRQEEIA